MRTLLLILISLVLTNASAQSYPSRPIQIIVPFVPGGGTDLLARVVADKLRDKFGQPVTVENRSGAAGNIGADAVFKAAPDGHTLLFTQPAPLVVNKALYGKLTFEPEQFVPIARSSATASYGSPDSRACNGASSSRGRGRLPTCVVRILRSPRFMPL